MVVALPMRWVCTTSCRSMVFWRMVKLLSRVARASIGSPHGTDKEFLQHVALVKRARTLPYFMECIDMFSKKRSTYSKCLIWLADCVFWRQITFHSNARFKSHKSGCRWLLAVGLPDLCVHYLSSRGSLKWLCLRVSWWGGQLSKWWVTWPKFQKWRRRKLERQITVVLCSRQNNKESFGAFLIGLVDFHQEEQIDCDLSLIAAIFVAPVILAFADLIEKREALAKVVDFLRLRESFSPFQKLAQMPLLWWRCVFLGGTLQPAKLHRGLCQIAQQAGFVLMLERPMVRGCT